MLGMLKNCFKKTFSWKIYLLLYCILLIYLYYSVKNFNYLYLLFGIITMTFVFICSFIIEIIVFLICKKKYKGSFNLQINEDIKGKKYSEVIEYYLTKKYSIDQLISRKEFLETSNFDLGLDKIKTILFTAIITLAVSEMYYNSSKTLNREFILSFFGAFAIIFIFLPIIFSWNKLVKVTAPNQNEQMELKLLCELIDMEQTEFIDRYKNEHDQNIKKKENSKVTNLKNEL